MSDSKADIQLGKLMTRLVIQCWWWAVKSHTRTSMSWLVPKSNNLFLVPMSPWPKTLTQFHLQLFGQSCWQKVWERSIRVTKKCQHMLLVLLSTAKLAISDNLSSHLSCVTIKLHQYTTPNMWYFWEQAYAY